MLKVFEFTTDNPDLNLITCGLDRHCCDWIEISSNSLAT